MDTGLSSEQAAASAGQPAHGLSGARAETASRNIRYERDARAWLLGAAEDRVLAEQEWMSPGGLALLRCGRGFTAVRVPALVVEAAVGTSGPDAVETYLGEEVGGPCFTDRERFYYFLVPDRTARTWDAGGAAVCLDGSSFLGVPYPGLRRGMGSVWFWCVPPVGMRDLCDPGVVAGVVACGRDRLAEQAEQVFAGDSVTGSSGEVLGTAPVPPGGERPDLGRLSP